LVAGSYAFKITKGETTEIEVSSRLYPRVDLATAGIAPGTSMFLFHDINRTRFDDFREAVHDSDGLLMLNGAGEALGTPLTNPRAVGVSACADQGPRGFGRMQRTRRPGDDNDLAAHCERRPSLWVEPLGNWGPGAVMLHPALGTDPARIEARIFTCAGEITTQLVQANPATGGMRLDFTLKGDMPMAELRAELWRNGARVAEVWVNRWVTA